jgi:DNA-directed RNA polymerase sigma subunit (sigma70/sigma32)
VFNHPNREVDELAESCSLDVADRGGISLEKLGQFMGVTMERGRQLETEAAESAFIAVARLKRKLPARAPST